MKTQIIFTLHLALCCLACDDWNSVNAIDENWKDKTEDVTTSDDDGTDHPQGIYNYSTIAAHPRLLLSNDDLARLRTNLGSNADLNAVHNAVMRSSDDRLSTAPLTYRLEGTRLLEVSREALARILRWSYSYRMTNDQKYLARAEQELRAVCDFPDWNPSHFLDVAEMTMAVAIGYDWLYDRLSAETRSKIREAIKTKAFVPSKDASYNWFLTSNNNWNQVCNAGLTFGALAIYEGAKAESVEMIERALESNKIPLAAYGPDGNYSEGYMYWEYGTTFQTMFLAALDGALGSDQDLHKTPGFMETAEYMLYMSGTAGENFNYADCASNERPLDAMFWFAQKSGNPSLLCVEREKIRNGGLYVNSAWVNRLSPLVLIFGNLSTYEDIPYPERKVWSGKGEVPVVMARVNWGEANDTYLGIKGGMARSNHGHMDAGSFVYETDHVRWAMDFGMQEYSPLESVGIDVWNMSQNSTRWDVFRYNNFGHNTITLNGEKHLVQGLANFTQVHDQNGYRGGEIDLTPLYAGNLVSSVLRAPVLKNDGAEIYLEVYDVIVTKNEPVTLRWNMVTPATTTVSADKKTITLEKDGKSKRFFVEASSPSVRDNLTLTTWPTTPPNSWDEANPGTTMIGFEITLPVNQSVYFKVRLSN